MNYSIGIDLGGTNIKMAALDAEGALLERHTDPTVDHAFWSRRIPELIAQIETRRGAPAAGIGMATPGVMAADGLSVGSLSGKTKALDGLEGLNWTDWLGRARAVPLLNDGHAALLGEVWLGAARGLDQVILLTLGTGVGGAILADGRLLRGWRRIAGHLGHVTMDVNGIPSHLGTPGALELAIGDCTIRQRTAGRFSSTREMLEAASGGDQGAADVWRKSVHVLACACASFINVLDPQAIIIGGGIAQAGDALFVPLRAGLERIEYRIDERRVDIKPAALGEWAGAYGAARNAVLESA